MADPTTPAQDPLADELLAVRCLLGEPAAFDELVARWHEPLWRYLRRLLGEDDAAGDAVQECWIRILWTPPANAQEVAKGMRRARVLIIDGASHSLMGHSAVTEAMLKFLGERTP
jgi:hypothetical protein